MTSSYYILNSIYEFIEGTHEDIHKDILNNVTTLELNVKKYNKCECLFNEILNDSNSDVIIDALCLLKFDGYDAVVLDFEIHSARGQLCGSWTFDIDKLKELINECMQEDEYTIQQELIEDLNASRML